MNVNALRETNTELFLIIITSIFLKRYGTTRSLFTVLLPVMIRIFKLLNRQHYLCKHALLPSYKTAVDIYHFHTLFFIWSPRNHHTDLADTNREREEFQIVE